MITIHGINEAVEKKVCELIAEFLDRVADRSESRVAFLPQKEAIRFLGTAVFLRAGEQEKRLNPIRLGGSAGLLYSVEELQELSRYIVEKAKSGSLPEIYITNTRNSNHQDEKEIYADHSAPRRSKNFGRNGRDVPRPAGKPTPRGTASKRVG